MNIIEYLLNKVMQEACEVAQAASKCLEFGLHEVYPPRGFSNLEYLEREYNDLKGVLIMLSQEGLSIRDRQDLWLEKREKVRKWMDHSRRCGTLQDGSTANAVCPVCCRALIIAGLCAAGPICPGCSDRKNTHLRQSIVGAFLNWSEADWRTACTTHSGEPMSTHTAKQAMLELYREGHDYIPAGDCNNWSPKEGCLGHPIPKA